MNDKQQIEELTSIIDSFNIRTYANAQAVAKFLVEKYGYRKLPENAVVLTRDEHNRLKRDSNLFEELLKKYEKVVEENKSLLRLISLIDDLSEENLLDLDEWIETIKEQARKETAREIYEQLQGHGTTYVKKWIKERYGVEVEE